MNLREVGIENPDVRKIFPISKPILHLYIIFYNSLYYINT